MPVRVAIKGMSQTDWTTEIWFYSVDNTGNTVNRPGWSRIGLALLILHAAVVGPAGPAAINGHYIDCLLQDCSYFIANALGLLQSCTKPSILISLTAATHPLYTLTAAATHTHTCIHNSAEMSWEMIKSFKVMHAGGVRGILCDRLYKPAR